MIAGGIGGSEDGKGTNFLSDHISALLFHIRHRESFLRMLAASLWQKDMGRWLS
jgi:hypothetical protein